MKDKSLKELVTDIVSWLKKPPLEQVYIQGAQQTVGANSTLWFSVAAPADCRPIAVVGYYWAGVSGNAAALNVYSVALNGRSASFAVANATGTATVFKPNVYFLAHVRGNT